MGTPYEISPTIKMIDPVYQVVGDANWNSWSKIARLIKHMTWRSLASRYRGSALGFLWTLVNPIMLMFVYTFVFKNIFGQNATGVPFQVYLMTGILAWNFFSTAAIQASVSLVSGASLVNKSTFPRIVLPASAVLANAVNYLVALPLLFAFIVLSGVSVTVSILLLPCVFLLLTIIAIGLGALLSALMPFFQDLQHLIEVFFTMWFFLTPIVYDISLIPEKWRSWYALNPMVGIVEFIHTVFLGQPLHDRSLAISVVGTFGILLIGLWVFRRLAPHCTEV
jgi:homopolymeric O-antigen transport system permease protein